MEWWKLFSGTFVLIFLAELGDKTQLAAMAKTADSPDGSFSKWVVFLGASLALVSSTFIAVFLGHILKRYVPEEYIKVAAGGLFLVFGGMILTESYRSFRTPAVLEAGDAAVPVLPEAETDTAVPGVVGSLALRAAMDFESAAAQRYRRLAAEASPALAELLDTLAQEEEGHLARLRGLPPTLHEAAARPPRDSARVPAVPNSDSGTLEELIRHEEATADFYRTLADRTLIPSARAIFTLLAEEETSHARRLTEAARTAAG